MCITNRNPRSVATALKTPMEPLLERREEELQDTDQVMAEDDERSFSTSIFRFIRNRIPIRLPTRLAETGQYTQYDTFERSPGSTGRLLSMRSYSRFQSSTDDLDEQIPESPPPVYRSKTSLVLPSASDESIYDSESVDEESDVRATSKTRERRGCSFVAPSSAGVRVGFANQGNGQCNINGPS
jgi:hypothetical protein